MSEPAGVVLGETGSHGCLNLRGNAADPSFAQAVEAAAGTSLPVEPCTWSRTEDATAYWLGPDEWLLIVPNGREGHVEQRLRETLEGAFSVVDTSGGHCMLNLSGPRKGEVMQKSSPYDFHPRNFSPGRCVQTTFAQATALVAANADGSFDLVIRRSYADYVRQWIADAAEEYGLTRPAASPDSSRRSDRTPA